MQAIKCKNCGNLTPANIGAGRPRKYCDDDCWAEYWRNARQAKSKERHSGMVCEQCGSEFTGAYVDQRFCKRTCAARYKALHPNEYAKRESRAGLCPRFTCICVACGNPFEASYAKCKKCPPCHEAYKPQGKNHWARAKRFGVEYDSTITRTEVLDLGAWHCKLCDKPVDRLAEYPSNEYGSIDHITPMSLGGAHVWANVQAAHLGCNIEKGNRVSTQETSRAA
jgi:5-methylcytosine-specific restriction endonuclease McrA